jgi:diphthamide biosynthesis protein 2
LDFKDLITSEKPEVASRSKEARFSFIKGGYVEDDLPQGSIYTSVTVCTSFIGILKFLQH